MAPISSRKGQFYILIVLVLIVYLFTISPPVAQLTAPPSTFKLLYQNFMTEAPKVINSGVYDGNLTVRFRSFSDSYLSYAKTKAPDFRMAYALLDRGAILIVNSLNEPLNITSDTATFTVGSGTSTTINQTRNLAFHIGSAQYRFEFTQDPELKALFKKQEKNEVIIHVEG